MNPAEKQIYNLRVKILETPFRPLIKLLDLFGVNADIVSYSGLLIMVGFILALPHHLILAFWLLFARMLIDILDGPLARYQKTDSDRGKFVDVLMDNLAFAAFIFGVIRAGLMDGLAGGIYLFATELVIVLMIIIFNLTYKSDWFFFASAGSYPYNFIYTIYLLFTCYVFGSHNYLTGAAQIFSVLLGLKAIKDYWLIQKIKP
jgi:phosphatidylglycerophosphate synthase